MAPIPPTCRTRSRSCPPTAARSGQPSGSGPGPGTDRGRASSGAAPPHPIDVRLPGLSTQLSARLAATRRAGSSWVDRTAVGSRAALMNLPVVAIVGRPNVGKSTLLNRIVGRRAAIVEEQPGVTRDRKDVDADWLGRPFRLVDTGGWMAAGSDLDAKVSQQAERAIVEADVVLLVVDVTTGVTEEDSRVAELLRRSGKAVLLVANKVDDVNRESQVWELLSLGLGEPYPVSALHGRGTGDLLDAVVERLPAPPTVEDQDLADAAVPKPDEQIAVAIVGRPNVGKSTLFNQLTGDERSVVHDLPGTTRDSIDTLIETDLGPIRFVDTAGMRRKGKIDEGTEYYSLVRALQAVDKSDVALLIIDSTVGVTAQDQRLAERIDVSGSPIVVLLNKHELLEDAEARADLDYQVKQRLHFLGEAPVLKISALSGKGVHKLLPALSMSIED